ncbi:MAG: PD40 domain-containing protein [Bacteroidales bacterium]|nr:PD40 domain-containing protein [Bacteroidales bacterium]
MKKITKISFLMLFTIFAIVGCEANEDPIDDSLIIATATTGKYVIVSPSTGTIRAEVQPDVKSVNSLALGFQSKKAIVVSKEESGTFVKVIYTCDRETGGNLFQVTSEQDWDVMFVDISLAGPQIVFSAQNVNELSDDNIHKINEDGTGYERLSFSNEIVDCQGVSTKIWSSYDPAWSPDGSKIAFDCHLREVGSNHPHNSIVIMDDDGQNKQVLYDVPVEETHYKDICWTKDGEFLIFLLTEGTAVKVKALHVNSKAIVDITSHLTVEGLHTESLWTSPNENKITFNKYEPGGGDLYVIDFTVSNDQFQISGTYKMLASHQDNGLHFGAPDWQLWNGN